MTSSAKREWQSKQIIAESLKAVKSLVHTLGYIKEALPKKFAKGAIEISRLAKFDEERGGKSPIKIS